MSLQDGCSLQKNSLLKLVNTHISNLQEFRASELDPKISKCTKDKWHNSNFGVPNMLT